MSGFKNSHNECEDDDDEEDTERADGYCHFNNDGSSTTFTISLFGQDLAINQSPDSRTLGHGAVVWDSAVIFTKYLEENPSQCRWQDKSAVELGCGPGLSGIAAMLKGAAVTMTDLSKVTESLTTENAHRIYGQMTSKGSGTFPYPLVRPVVYPLDWTDWESFAALGGAERAPFDLVITTDCVFAVSLVEPLISCIRKLSGTHTTAIILRVFTIRYHVISSILSLKRRPTHYGLLLSRDSRRRGQRMLPCGVWKIFLFQNHPTCQATSSGKINTS